MNAVLHINTEDISGYSRDCDDCVGLVMSTSKPRTFDFLYNALSPLNPVKSKAKYGFKSYSNDMRNKEIIPNKMSYSLNIVSYIFCPMQPFKIYSITSCSL